MLSQSAIQKSNTISLIKRPFMPNIMLKISSRTMRECDVERSALPSDREVLRVRR
jgi:hypothetical protein